MCDFRLFDTDSVGLAIRSYRCETLPTHTIIAGPGQYWSAIGLAYGGPTNEQLCEVHAAQREELLNRQVAAMY